MMPRRAPDLYVIGDGNHDDDERIEHECNAQCTASTCAEIVFANHSDESLIIRQCEEYYQTIVLKIEPAADIRDAVQWIDATGLRLYGMYPSSVGKRVEEFDSAWIVHLAKPTIENFYLVAHW